jgi:hypothetical protein
MHVVCTSACYTPTWATVAKCRSVHDRCYEYHAGAPDISNACNSDRLHGYASRQRPLHRQRQRQALRPNRSRPHRRMSAAFFGVFSLLPSVQRATVTYTRFRLCITSWPCACGRTCNVMLRWQDRRAILLCRDPLLQAAEGIRQSIASGNQAVIPGLVDTLLSASRPFDERQIGGGPWQVRPKLASCRIKACQINGARRSASH